VTAALRATARPEPPPAGDLQVIKSVHSPAAAGLVSALGDATVVVIRRNPLNGVASWLDLDWWAQPVGGSATEQERLGALLGSAPPDDDAPIEQHHAWSFSALTRVLDLEAERHPDWVVVQHEDLCRDPVERFRELFERIEVPLGRSTEEALRSHEGQASGYVTQRVAADQPDRWRERLSDEQAELIRRTAASLSIDC
jgi:hypothetical protein